jgi:hypothetical protein
MSLCMRKLAVGLVLTCALAAMLGLVGCISVPAQPELSPLQRPQNTAVPIPSATVMFSPTPDPSLKLLPGMALTPEDMSDLFQASFSITQPVQRPGMRGVQVMYPTKIIEHTSGFAGGFATAIQIYDTVDGAGNAFKEAAAAQRGQLVSTAPLGDESQISLVVTNKERQEVKPDAADADTFAYDVLVRKGRGLVFITIKAPQAVAAERLGKAANAVLSRLGTAAS